MKIAAGAVMCGPDGGQPFHVSSYEKRLLLESIAQAERGGFVDADDLLAELDELN